MPFEKGHPPYPPKPGSSTLPRGAARQRVQLAHYLNEAITAEEITRWLREVAAGRDPDAKQGDFSTAPDWPTRRAAMAMILERRNGRPAQHVHLEAEMRAAIGVASISATPESIATMPREDRDQLRALLRRVVVPRVVTAGRDTAVRVALEAAARDDVAEHDVVDAIDADSTEVEP